MIIDIRFIKYIFFIELIIICIVAAYIGALTPIISNNINVNFFLMGVASSIYYFALFISSILTGKLVQLFNYKKILIVGILLSFFGNLGLFFSYQFHVFLFPYLINGFGFGFVFISINSFICNFYYFYKNKLLFFINSGWLIGVFLSPLLVNIILWLKLNWRITFLLISIFQIIISLLVSRIKFPVNNDKYILNHSPLLKIGL